MHVLRCLLPLYLMENEVGSTFQDVEAKLHLINVKNAPEFLSERCQTRQQSIRQQGKHYTRQRGACELLKSKQGAKL